MSSSPIAYLRSSEMPCRGFFAAVVCSFIFIIGDCLAETAHASHTSSVASLESLLEAKIPATSEKATKDYEAARSIFKRSECAQFFSCEPCKRANFHVTDVLARKVIDLKALDCIPRGLICGAQPCSKPECLCIRSLKRYETVSIF